MGCDYYIIKFLRIYFENDDVLSLEIDRESGYYYYAYDSDDEDYETKVEEYIKECLTPNMETINIYGNNEFNKSKHETKYKSIVEKFMNERGRKFSDITKIIKVEERYERN